MADNVNTIELRIGDVGLSVSGSEDFVEEHFYDLYEKHGFDEAELSGVDILSTDVQDKPSGKDEKGEREGKTVNEYLANSGASTKQDNALVIGWYLENVKGYDDFTPSEVKEEGDASKVPLGVKLKRDLDNNVQKGHLHSPGQRDGEDTYWVTDTGEKYLEDLGIPVV